MNTTHTRAVQPPSAFDTVVLPWLHGQAVEAGPVIADAPLTPAPRVTRYVALCVLLAWAGVAFVAATVLQVAGVWSWEPTPAAMASVACFLGAAMVATLWLPGERELCA